MVLAVVYNQNEKQSQLYLIQTYLPHLLNAIGENVGNHNPFLRRRPEVHFNKYNVVEEH